MVLLFVNARGLCLLSLVSFFFPFLSFSLLFVGNIVCLSPLPDISVFRKRTTSICKIYSFCPEIGIYFCMHSSQHPRGRERRPGGKMEGMTQIILVTRKNHSFLVPSRESTPENGRCRLCPSKEVDEKNRPMTELPTREHVPRPCPGLVFLFLLLFLSFLSFPFLPPLLVSGLVGLLPSLLERGPSRGIEVPASIWKRKHCLDPILPILLFSKVRREARSTTGQRLGLVSRKPLFPPSRCTARPLSPFLLGRRSQIQRSCCPHEHCTA
mmetsp:Transcript_43023/g.111236  ORF Transcript_43023/g.111236 Transcript_43023/m.111236 type:complete len:268 (+) Transcript_43023:2377-3180(+)